jgi:hypothetical protein
VLLHIRNRSLWLLSLNNLLRLMFLLVEINIKLVVIDLSFLGLLHVRWSYDLRRWLHLLCLGRLLLRWSYRCWLFSLCKLLIVLFFSICNWNCPLRSIDLACSLLQKFFFRLLSSSCSYIRLWGT